MTMSLAEQAPVLGHHAHVAAALFEIEGVWSTDEVAPAAAAHFARHSRYHGWHAELWSDLLPDSSGLADLAVVGPPDPIWTDQLAAVAVVADTAGRLAALHRCVLPRLLVATRFLLGGLSPVGDAPVIRAGGFVVGDLQAEQDEGEVLLHRLVPAAALDAALGTASAIDAALSESAFGRCGA